MATYRQLLSERDFLKVQLRARAVSKNGTVLKAIYYVSNQLIFQTRSATEPGIIYTERIELSDLNIDAILKAKKFRDIENMIKNGDIKIYCSCPAFLFWGYKYMAWKRGYGLEKENRRPVIRNPYQKGFVCKHLYFIMQIFPLLARPIASKWRLWAQKKVAWTGTKESKYFGKYGVQTNLAEKEKLSLRDSAEEISDNDVIKDEPLITDNDIMNNNVEPVVDTADINPEAMGPQVADFLPEDVQDTGNGFTLDSSE